MVDKRFISIKAKFIEMGLSLREMTILSVGGHTIGAVRDTASMSATVLNRTFATFDSTPTVFDNQVFIEMLAGILPHCIKLYCFC